jgi:hypothetical protein
LRVEHRGLSIGDLFHNVGGKGGGPKLQRHSRTNSKSKVAVSSETEHERPQTNAKVRGSSQTGATKAKAEPEASPKSAGSGSSGIHSGPSSARRRSVGNEGESPRKSRSSLGLGDQRRLSEGGGGGVDEVEVLLKGFYKVCFCLFFEFVSSSSTCTLGCC